MSDEALEDLEHNLANAVTALNTIKNTARGALENYFGDDFYKLCAQGMLTNQPLLLIYDMAGECLERIGEPESADREGKV